MGATSRRAPPMSTGTSPADSQSFSTRWPGWQRGLGLLLGVLLLAAAGWAGWALSLRQGTSALRQEAGHRLDLFASAVEGVVKRLEPLPATIQLNPEVLALLRAAERGTDRRDPLLAVNTYLRRLNAHLGSLAVFVLDERGTVLASSNSSQTAGPEDDSRVGQDVAFRPYFLEALSGRVGRHFAIGVGSGEPGYFVSHPIRDGARVVGVAAIKISLAPVEQTWELLGAPALLSDMNQVVILSSEAAWRYTTLADPGAEQRVEWQLSRLYEGQQLRRFPLDVKLSIDEDSQELEGLLPTPGLVAQPRAGSSGAFGMLVLGRALDGMDWRLMLFADMRAVRNQAALTGVLTAVAAGFVGLLALYLNQRQRIVRQKLRAQRMLQEANAELEHKVARRTRALTETNVRLRKEVAEREQAEQTLRAAQNELVHAAKMAVLGQLATGITHELTQPLGAIRTLSGNASEFLRRGDLKAVESNLAIVARLADQMGGIIQPLKGFARKSEPKPQATDVAYALGNALFLYNQRIRKEQVQLVNATQPGQVIAWCDPNRLEQVLINLIGNALDAMRDAPARRLRLSAGVGGPRQALNDTQRVARAVALASAEQEEGAEAATQLARQQTAQAQEIWIRVEDSGAGFDDGQHVRLFEPFFTTKDAGAGLGLGLAISRDIVRAFGGDILAHSPARDDAADAPAGSRGACFTVWLPAAPPLSPLEPTTHA